MKQFTLGEYLRNPERKVVTKDGRPVRIICTDKEGDDEYKIVVLVRNKYAEEVYTYKANGTINFLLDRYDLFFAPVKQSRWVYLHKNAYGDVCSSRAFMTEDDAKEAMEVLKGFGLTEITWEE